MASKLAKGTKATVKADELTTFADKIGYPLARVTAGSDVIVLSGPNPYVQLTKGKGKMFYMVDWNGERVAIAANNLRKSMSKQITIETIWEQCPTTYPSGVDVSRRIARRIAGSIPRIGYEINVATRERNGYRQTMYLQNISGAVYRFRVYTDVVRVGMEIH